MWIPLPIFSLDFVCKLVPLPSHLKKCFLGFVVHCRRCAGFGFFSFAAILFRFAQHGDHRCILSSASTRCFLTAAIGTQPPCRSRCQYRSGTMCSKTLS